MASNRGQRRLISQELTGLQTLVPKGYVSLNRVLAMQRAEADLNGNHGAYQADFDKSQSAITEKRMQILSVEKEKLEGVANQMRDVQVRLDEFPPELFSFQAQIGRSTVRATASGRVVGLKVFTVGGVVLAGEDLMEILAQDRRLVIHGRAAPTDADDLQPGMETQVRFSALRDRSLPILHGRVSKVSADSFEDERTGTHYFKIEVGVPPEELAKIRQSTTNGLVAGLPATILVPLRKRSAMTHLIEPLTQTLWKAGREH